MPSLIGASIPRVEDRRLITGAGCYTDDVRAPDAVYAAIVRSPFAHATIVGTLTADALASPGTITIVTAADYRADGGGAIRHVPNPADAIDWQRPGFIAPAGGPPIADVAQLPLADGRVRFVGEAVAVVIAATAAQARDAAALVEVEYEALPAVVDGRAALAADAPLVWDSVPGNCCFDLRFGDAAATDRAFASAHLVVEHEFVNQRLASVHMEPRAALASYDPEAHHIHVVAGSQGVMKYRASIAAALGVAPEGVTVETRDVGGGFGSRTNLHPEPLLVAWLARRIGRTVRWTGDRSEGFQTDFQGRDIAERAAVAFDRDGRMLAMRATLVGNVGAYTVGYAPLQNCLRITTSVYDVPLADVRVRAALTNTTPTAPYRGAGRPEATYAVERLLDIGAQRLGIDRVEIRRRNLISLAALPYTSAVGLTYDSGDFRDNMERTLARADWTGFPARRAAADARGMLRGIGVANYIEAPVGAVRERVVVRVEPGSVTIETGTQSTGQGHETTFAQVAATYLDVPFESVTLRTGDSRALSVGGGTHSNRSMRLVGTLLVRACTELRGRASADHGTSSVFTAAERAGEPLVAEADFAGRIAAHPTGCAICELEIDPATGAVRIERYTQVDDVGQAINPLILDGQTHGGIAQGIGQALFEQIGFDSETGALSGGSFMDYAVPRANQLPHYDVELSEHPTTGNPLRIKGGGEGGVTPAPAAIVGAICDALRSYGIEHIETPVTPEKIWRALQRGAAAATLDAAMPELATR